MKPKALTITLVLIVLFSFANLSVLSAAPPAPSKSRTGSGFFISKMGHVITNAHVVKGCNRITVGDNANKQVPAEVVNTDRSNDLALLKLSSLEMASAESKSLIQKLSIVVVPLASKGLLRSDDVRLGEKVLVAGFPFGDLFSNTIKVTSGIVSATRGAGDDSGQFQLDAAIQPGNSGGPIYGSGGNIVGVVISQLDKLKVAKAIGSLPENVNFGIKASTVRQFLISSGLPSKKADQAEEKSTEQLAEIAQNQALMLMCHRSDVTLSEEPEVKKEYWDNGKLKSESHVKNGKLDGMATHWSESGKKVREDHHKNGKLDVRTYWYESGEKEIETHYKNGKEDGLRTYWYESGKKEIELHYKNGKKEGLRTYWYESGQKQEESHFKNDKENGLRTEWDEDGEKTFQGNFVDGNER